MYRIFYYHNMQKTAKTQHKQPKKLPHEATMAIIGNYRRKLRFSDTKSSKRATPHSFLLLLFLKFKFPPLPLFRSEILPKIAPLGRKLSNFVSISAVFLPFFCYYFFFVSFFTDFISFSLFCLLLSMMPMSDVFTV